MTSTMSSTATYSTHEVAELTGLTFRQLDYWARLGVIWPEVEARGSGSQRQWSEQQAEWLLRIGDAYRIAEHRGLALLPSAVGHIWTALMAGEDWEVNLCVAS